MRDSQGKQGEKPKKKKKKIDIGESDSFFGFGYLLFVVADNFYTIIHI